LGGLGQSPANICRFGKHERVPWLLPKNPSSSRLATAVGSISISTPDAVGQGPAIAGQLHTPGSVSVGMVFCALVVGALQGFAVSQGTFGLGLTAVYGFSLRRSMVNNQISREEGLSAACAAPCVRNGLGIPYSFDRLGAFFDFLNMFEPLESSAFARSLTITSRPAGHGWTVWIVLTAHRTLMG